MQIDIRKNCTRRETEQQCFDVKTPYVRLVANCAKKGAAGVLLTPAGNKSAWLGWLTNNEMHID